MMTKEEFFGKLFTGGNSYWLPRFVILRLLGFVYAVASLMAAQQLVPLVGEAWTNAGERRGVFVSTLCD
jgi:hypothetical protein